MLLRILAPLTSLVCAAQAVPSPAGPWSGAIQVPGMALGIQVTLTKADSWKGVISIPDQGLKDSALADVVFAGSDISFRMPGIAGDPTFKGRLEMDGGIRGTFSQGGQSFPFALKPGALPVKERPAPQAKSPCDQTITFPGFNAFPLKGSVRAAQGAGYFAVLVAGSGPTDRNWSNPLILDPATGKVLPSHGGRDFAGWLAQQGVSVPTSRRPSSRRRSMR